HNGRSDSKDRRRDGGFDHPRASGRKSRSWSGVPTCLESDSFNSNKAVARSRLRARDQILACAMSDKALTGYGQRFALSSHPAARAGWAAAFAGCGILMGCWPVEDPAKVGLFSLLPSLSSDRRGAATRSASTSFSSL